tara:strand:- start:472 stop:1716 length:1245 start_codon:yes stop_codon:yes gene_type:complete
MMKKQLLLSLLVIISTSSLFAQIKMEAKKMHEKAITKNVANNKSSASSAGGWFNFADEIEAGELSNDANFYTSTMHVDSTVVACYIDDNGDTIYYNVSNFSVGQLLDPTSTAFENTGYCEPFQAQEGFILDSIMFGYSYARPIDANDKVIIQVYSTGNAGISSGSLVSGGTFYNIEYDQPNKKGKNAVWEQEWNLTDADTVEDGYVKFKAFAIDPPITMLTGGLLAATYTFHPEDGSWNAELGDTVYRANQPWIQNSINRFSGRVMQDLGPFNDGTTNYNLEVGPEIQYNVSSSGWDGQYYPGNSYTVNNSPIMQHQDISFHLNPIPPTSTNNINSTNIKLYPNPANNKISIAFDNLTDATNIRITDVTGRTVYTETITNNTIAVNTSHYTPGIYFCEIKGTKTNETIKFTKIK